MNKTWIVAKREFLSRVQKKTFLLTTILLPVIIFGFYAAMIYFSVKSTDDFKVAIADKANIFGGKIESKDDIKFSFLNNETVETLKGKIAKKEYDGYVVIDKNFNPTNGDSLVFISGKTVGLITRSNIQKRINTALEDARLLSSLHITKVQLDSLQKGNEVTFSTLEGKAEGDDKASASLIAGYVSGFLIYIVLFIYGTMVMRGVMEEKTNRIAEVIISSVKPFQLMMGKITGIGAVGLLQFFIWICLTVILRILLPMLIPGMAEVTQPGATQALQTAKSSGAFSAIMAGLSDINMLLVIPCFIFYFLGGYLLYSALFAAVGSTVSDDVQEAQSLVFPIIMPIIFGIVIMTKAVNDPTSGLAVFGSLFPLTSPIVMMARIPFGVPSTVPYWQLILSMALLVGGFLSTTWLSAKIYRVGILMYGKKVNWKEMSKWAFRKY